MSTRYALGRREGITEELVAALADYEGGPFSAREKAALRYADRLFFDHHRVDDALWDELSDLFTEEERLELTWVLSEFIGLGKVMYVLGVQHGSHAHV
jgi:alkylhydroperoxidase family enzyme